VSVLEELGTYLQTAGLGTMASTLFLGALPEDAPGVSTPDLIAALVEIPGFPPEYTHDILGPSREFPMIQLLVRGAPYDYATPREWAQALLMALGSIRNQALSGTFYLGAMPWHTVYKLRDDDYARPIMSAQVRMDKAAWA
jgi:Bacteriophage minor capsid protein